MLKNWKLHLEHYVSREWQRRGLFSWALRPLSYLFGITAALRRASFTFGLRRVEHLSVPVIIVGNVTVGGTGKTPTVIALIDGLRRAGFNPGVISRGYGAQVKAPRAVSAQSDATEVGDEPLLIAQRTAAPVWVCPDRVAAARALCTTHPEVDLIISDDGLQHYRLARAVELVVFDQRLGGNGLFLPAGPLREPMSRRRDATLINGSSPHALPSWPNTFALNLTTGAAWHLDNPSLRRPLHQFVDKRILAAAGIGEPERFFSTLRTQGLTLTATRALPDHFAYIANPFSDAAAEIILITEKDAVKCQGWCDARLWVVPVDATLDSRLLTLITEKVRGSSFT